MIDYRANEIVIVEALKTYLTSKDRACEVVRQNQVAEVPPYPYVSYTVTTPVSEDKGTYNETEDGTLYKSILQTWSFTAQSNDQDEALTLATKIYDFFTVVAHSFLADNNITVRRVRNVTTRDNFISIQYEFRNGLDVTFGLLSVIEPSAQVYDHVIETNKFKEV